MSIKVKPFQAPRIPEGVKARAATGPGRVDVDSLLKPTEDLFDRIEAAVNSGQRVALRDSDGDLQDIGRVYTDGDGSRKIEYGRNRSRVDLWRFLQRTDGVEFF